MRFIQNFVGPGLLDGRIFVPNDVFRHFCGICLKCLKSIVFHYLLNFYEFSGLLSELLPILIRHFLIELLNLFDLPQNIAENGKISPLFG